MKNKLKYVGLQHSSSTYFRLCFKLFTGRLTGRPSAAQWPSGLSISRETFPQRQQRLPRDLCPPLCEYSNDLLSEMLAFDPRDRPSALNCLNHAYFQQEPL